jgi:hypothetical protein
MNRFYYLFVSLFFVSVVLAGCVDTDSSSRTSGDGTDTTIPDDTNTTDPDDTDTGDGGDDDLNYDDFDPNADQDNSDFDTRGAILDPNACKQGGVYGEPLSDLSTDNQYTEDSSFGVSVGSRLPLSAQLDLSRVFLYYPNSDATAYTQTNTGTSRSVTTSQFVFSYDIAWVGNVNRTFYVRTPNIEENNGYLGCYRYVLDSVNVNEIEMTKVYRLR